MNTLSNFITCDSNTANGVVRYTVDVAIASVPGFDAWYNEAAEIATLVGITFVKEGNIVGYCEYNN